VHIARQRETFSNDLGTQYVLGVVDGVEDAFAVVFGGVAIAEFDGFVVAFGGA